jgi:hypothetical protein
MANESYGKKTIRASASSGVIPACNGKEFLSESKKKAIF